MEEIILDGKPEETLTPLERKTMTILKTFPSEVEGKKNFISYRKLAELAGTSYDTIVNIMLNKVFEPFKCDRKGKTYCGSAENIAWLRGQQ